MRQIGPYKFARVLGAGGMDQVFLAVENKPAKLSPSKSSKAAWRVIPDWHQWRRPRPAKMSLCFSALFL
jgi:hypothetical protein